jgi:dextranase
VELADFYPGKGSYHPGETIELRTELSGRFEPGVRLEVVFWRLARQVDELSCPLEPDVDPSRFVVHWQPPDPARRGYGVQASLTDRDGRVLGRRWTAFDVLRDWSDFPRYGFLTDFDPGRQDLDDAFDELRRFHINGLQFYDWQHRHDRLLPDERTYPDPLGRVLSLDTLEACLAKASQAGMASMAYAAVYAASAAHWRVSPEAALYDAEGEPIPFGDDFLGLMNPAPGGPWASHLQDELSRALRELPFDGIHLDQYGEPQEGFDHQGAPVDLPGAFVDFIAELHVRHPDAPITFNAVGGWPLTDLTQAPLNFLYVEVWPPMVSYEHIVQMIMEARAASPHKAVVIACYMPPESSANLLLLEALAFSLGGSRIEIGETGRLLSDPYFPKHQAIPLNLKTKMRDYYDFAVRYGEMLGPHAANLNELQTELPDQVWVFPRQAGRWLTLCLINLRGIDPPHWYAPHHSPSKLEHFSIEIPSLDREVRRVWWASPDRGEPGLRCSEWERLHSGLRISVPQLDTWSIVALETTGGTPTT